MSYDDNESCTDNATGDVAFNRRSINSERAIRRVKFSLAVLVVTALFQLALVTLSGSVGLLADTIRNLSEALSAIPLLPPMKQCKRHSSQTNLYSYLDGIARILILIIILAGAGVAGYESIERFFFPRPVTDLSWVAAGSVAGFLGNEAAAFVQIHTGKAIGSSALIAGGQQARIRSLTSLVVLAGAIGITLGLPLADPIAGLLLTGAIITLLRVAAARWRRLNMV